MIICYILQILFTSIFGPLFAAIYCFKDRLRLPEQVEKDLQNLQDEFIDTNAQFAIPTSIAAAARLLSRGKNLPFYEIGFLGKLVAMQLLGTVSAAIAATVVSQKRKNGIVYAIMDYIIFVITVASSKDPTVRGNLEATITIEKLMTLCSNHDDKLIPDPGNLGIDVLIPLVAPLAILIHQFLATRMFPILDLQNRQFTNLLLSLAIMGVAVFHLVNLLTLRSVMKGVTGYLFQDNQWGFGQIVSLFLWIPLLGKFAYRIFSYCWYGLGIYLRIRLV